MGQLYTLMGEYEKGVQYFEEELKVRLELYGEDHLDSHNTYMGLAESYYERDQYEQAINWFIKALKFEDLLYEAKSPNLISIYRFLALSYSGLGKKDVALLYSGKAYAISVRIEETGYFSSLVLNDRAVIHHNFEEYQLAKDVYRQCLDSFSDFSENSGSILTHIYRNVGDNFEALGEYDSALHYLQMAHKVNQPWWTPKGLYDLPDSEQSFSSDLEVLVIASKIKAIESKLGLNANTQLRERLLMHYDYLIALLNSERSNSARIKDKLNVSNYLMEVVEAAIKLCLEEYAKTQNNSFLERSLQYAETTKEVILYEALRFNQLRIFRNVPSDLQNLQEQLKVEQSQLLSNLQALKRQKANPTKVDSVKSSLFMNTVRKDSINRILKSQFPRYFELMDGGMEMSIGDVRKQLSTSEVLLAYFLGREKSWVFAISRNELYVEELRAFVGKDNPIDEFSRFLTPQAVHETSSSEFETAGLAVFEALVDPIKPILEGKDKILVVPSGKVGSVPFDLVIDEVMVGSKAYEDLNYLAKKFEISYSYSVKSLITEYISESVFAQNFVGFAPTYGDSLMYPDFALRSYLTPLLWNEKEVKNISEVMEGVQVLNDLASESSFKEYARNSRIIHIAGHALIDEADPLNSRLVLSLEDTLNDGYLHTFELYNMTINAEFVSLSACQTGVGKYENGEGTMSLSRGFSYSGVPSLMLTLWQVDDLSSSKIMTEFYENLKGGQGKAEALRGAKLTYLESEPNKHPFFWGPYLVIGKNDPLFSNHYLKWSLIFVISILIVLTIIIGKIKSKSRGR